MAEEVSFILDGEGVTLAGIELADLAYMLEQFELAVKDVARDAGDDPAEVKLSLVGVAEGSGDYTLRANKKAIAHTAKIAAAVSNRNGTSIPWNARAKVERIHGRAGKRRMSVEVKGEKSPGVHFRAKMLPNERLFDAPRSFGATTVVARVIRSGGEQGSRTAELELSDGQKIVAAVQTKELAVDLGKLLYETVELHGRVIWNSENWKIHKFTVIEIGSYSKQGSSPTSALNELRGIVGGMWDQIDVTSHFLDLRAGDDEVAQ